MTADASGTLYRQRCEFCGAVVNTLRRGRCWGCYQRWQESQPVGTGAACVVCNERRLDNLQRVELYGRWLPMCHLCAVRTRRLQPLPASVDGIRRSLRRDRREHDRRSERPDTRLEPKDRRGPDRRAIPIDEGDILAMEELPTAELVELALDLAFDTPVGEATWIYEKLAEADLVEATVRKVVPPPRQRAEVSVVEGTPARRVRPATGGTPPPPRRKASLPPPQRAATVECADAAMAE